MNGSATKRRPSPQASDLSTVFNFDEPAERFMYETWRRFHRCRRYAMITARRTSTTTGQCVVLEVALCQR